MNYEINVARNGTHLFATAERSITDSDKCKVVYDELKKAFPDCELTVNASPNISYGVDMDNMDASVNGIWKRVYNQPNRPNQYLEITPMMWLRLTSHGIPKPTKTNNTELALIIDYLIDDVRVRTVLNHVASVEQYYIQDINS